MVEMTRISNNVGIGDTKTMSSKTDKQTLLFFEKSIVFAET